jgi:hypothetical protein
LLEESAGFWPARGFLGLEGSSGHEGRDEFRDVRQGPRREVENEVGSPESDPTPSSSPFKHQQEDIICSIIAKDGGRWEQMPEPMLESFFTIENGKDGDRKSLGVEKRSEASRCPQHLSC